MRILTVSLCLLIMTLGACGGEDPGKGLTSSTAGALTQELASVERRIDQGSLGACEDVLEDSVPTIQRRLDSLPAATDPELRSALDDSFDRLRTLSEQECDERRQKAEDRKTERETSPTIPTPTEPPPPPTTTETTPPPTTETTPKPDEGDEDEGKGKGKGKGKGDDGGTGGSQPRQTPGEQGDGSGGTAPEATFPEDG